MRGTLFLAAIPPLAACLLIDCVGDVVPEPAATDDDGGGDTSMNPTSDASAGGDGSPGTDGGSPSDGAAPVDTGVDARDASGPACDVNKPFGAPTGVAALNTANQEEFARISPNGLELFVTRYPVGDPEGRRHIDRHTRTSILSPWILQETESILSNPVADAGAATGLTLSPDGLTGYFQLYPNWTPASGGSGQIYGSTRPANDGGAWTTPVAVNGIGVAGSNEGPFLATSGNRIYFFSSRAGGFHVFYANKNVNGFDTPVAAFVTTPVDDRYPVVTADELTMYIGQYGNPPDSGAPNMNIYKATRAATTNGFDAPVFVPELNAAPSFTGPSWISPDGCSILLFSTRAGGNTDIFSAVKPL